MPNRIIKESICTSEDYAKLTLFQRDLFIRLIVSADDFGRYDARPAILRGRLYPLENVTSKSIDDALAALANLGIVALYEVNGKPYLYLLAWDKHQYRRAAKSKFPAPECGIISSEIICKQPRADSLVNEERGTINDKRETNVCTEQDSAPAYALPLNDKTDFSINEKDITEWSALYPAVDVIQQLRSMKGWLNNNPAKRKTRNGIKRFINSWLSREQDKGGSKVLAKMPNYSNEPNDDLDRLERMLKG